MFESVFSSFALVAASEMGDKTQLLAFSLAARFRRPAPILAGILVATILNHALAAAAGEWIGRAIPAVFLAYLLGFSFIGFGFWTLAADKDESKDLSPRFGVFGTTAVLFFLAEMGDKTQFATAALGARYQAALEVTIGTTLGMMLADGPAVLLGERFASRFAMAWVRRAAAILFFAFGAASLWRAATAA